jgi:hypothetical protein
MRKHREDLFSSPAPGEGPQFHSGRRIAAPLADWRRIMSAIEKQNAKRDRVWPRNYGCWIRAPESVELLSSAIRRTQKGNFNTTKNIARHKK